MLTFYAMPHSLYSGRARCYLIKQHAPFREVSAGHSHFYQHIKPQIGRWIMPVLESDDGTIIQDSTDIIDWYENNNEVRLPARPTTPRHLIASYIFEMFGSEGLLRPAMHYRWNFDEHNLAFIQDQFGLFAMPHTIAGVDAAARHDLTARSMTAMRGAGKAFGVSPETAPHIEAAYLELLDELNAHFSAHPYLLGGCPTLGDYGLIAPLYAHLGRDPYSSNLMQQRARAVYRWRERMNAPFADMGEFPEYNEALLPDDNVPDTLKVLLRRVAHDYLPEIKAMVAFHNHWLGENTPQAGAVVGGGRLARGIGFCTFEWNGIEISTVVMPYRVFMLQRIQDAYDALAAPARADVDALLTQTGLSDIITTRCVRRVQRVDNLETWA